MTQIYLMKTEDAAGVSEEYCRERFPVRTGRAERYRFREDRLRCIGAGILLSEILGIKEKDLIFGPQGKPSCPVCGKEFSLSHSGKYILLAVDDRPVGADIEEIKEAHLPVARRVLQPEELLWMQEDAPKAAERFFRLWTMKESVMKALGRGFSLSPESFGVLPLLNTGTGRVGGTELRGYSGVRDGYAIGLCTADGAENCGREPEILFYSGPAAGSGSRKASDL